MTSLLRRCMRVATTSQARTFIKCDKFQVVKRSDGPIPENMKKLPELPMERPLWPDEETLGKKAKAKLPRNTKRTFEFRGEEEIHNTLWLRQYGVQAIDGGMMEPDHFEMVHKLVNERIKPRMYAIWRVEAPYYTRTRKPKGEKRGGGKGKIHHYLTPIRRNRIIVEMGGELIYEEAQAILADVASRLPFRARFITQERLDEEAELDREIARLNRNPFNWETFCRFNMLDCVKHLSPYDHAYRGKWW